MKKLLSWVLTFSMLLGMVGVTAFADDPVEVDRFEITVGDVVVGQTPADVEVNIPDDAHYTIVKEEWSVDGAFFDGTFASGTAYRLLVRMKLEDGYVPADEIEAVRNGAVTRNYAKDEIEGQWYVEIQTDFPLGMTVIDQVEVSSLPAIVEGAPTTGMVVTARSGGVEQPDSIDLTTNWVRHDYVLGAQSYTEPTLGRDEYALEMIMAPKAGYWFAENVTVMGGDVNHSWYRGRGSELRFEQNYDTRVKLNRVEVLMDEPVVGGDLPEPTVPAGQHVSLANYEWTDSSNVPVTGKVQDGKSYLLKVNLALEAGYALAGSGEVTLNDMWVSAERETDHISFTQTYSFLQDVEDLTITVADLEVGKDLPVPTIPAGLHVTLEDYEWTDENDDPVTGKVQEKKQYYLMVTLKAADGWSLEDTDVIISGGDQLYRGGSSQQMEFRAGFHTYPLISRVEVLVPDYQPGDSTEKDGLGADENNDIVGTRWYDWTDDQDLTPPATLEDGKAYELEVNLAPVGEVFYDLENLQVYVNGELLDERYYSYYNQHLDIYYPVNLCQQITTLDLPEMELEPEAGDTAPGMVMEDKTGYQLGMSWMDENYDPVTSFAAGGYYVLVAEAEAKDGYWFSEDLTVTMGGKELEDAIVMNYGEGMGIFVTSVNMGNANVISRIDLVTDSVYEVGGAVKEIKAAEGAHFTVEGIGWWGAASKKFTRGDEVTGTFAADRYYWISGSLLAENGYTFDMMPVITLNGEEMVLDQQVYEEMGIVPGMDRDAVLFVDMGQLKAAETGGEGGQGGNGSPDTGDAGILLYAVMGTLSLAGATTVVSRKRRAR